MVDPEQVKRELRNAVDIILDAVSAKAFLAKHESLIRRHPVVGRVRADVQQRNKPVTIIGIGKMADSMAWEFVQLLALQDVQGIVSSPYETDVPKVTGLQYFRGGHPEPNEQSLAAAKASVDRVAALKGDEPVVYLISGGGSGCFEWPDPRLSLDQIRNVYGTLVKCGADIRDINRIRRRLSLVKGGKLLAASGSRNQLTLVVSDVPGSELEFVSSGPTCNVNEPSSDLRSVIDQHDLSNQLPDVALDIIGAQEADFHDIKGSNDLDPVCVGSNEDAIAAAVKHFRNFGWNVKVDTSYDEKPVAQAAKGLVESVLKMPQGLPGCVVAGGELISKVSGPGRGGRNQAFVLECVPLIRDRNMAVMSFGTDGIDGNSLAAGAIADGSSFRRAIQHGLNPKEFATASDSFTFFSTLHDSIETGPTQTNVRDIIVLVKFD